MAIHDHAKHDRGSHDRGSHDRGSHDHGTHAPAPALTRTAALEMLTATVPPRRGSALVLLPAALTGTASSLADGLAELGLSVETTLVLDESFRQASCATEAAMGWVPAPARHDHDLLLLCGARPWAVPFDDDHLIELAAMAHREALVAAGRRLVFVEWPRGARRDLEVDLRPEAMAALFERAVRVDYGALRASNRRLQGRLRGARELRVECDDGTALTVSVAGRTWLSEDCLLGAEEPAIYLPGGEVYAPAIEDSAAGRVAFKHVGAPRIARFEAGLLVAVETPSGTADTSLGEELGVGSEPLCEVGLGTNPEAPPWQVGALYEKSAGTLHVAVGGNAHFGGQRDSPRHMDLIVRRPRVWVDGEPLDLPEAAWTRHSPRPTV